MGKKILAVNPGSTSTKIAVYEDKSLMFAQTIDHDTNELDRYGTIQDQFEMRKEAVLRTLDSLGIKPEELSAAVGRGGILPPVMSGAYLVNDLMIERLKNNPIVPHASNLGALIVSAIAKPVGIPSMIYDSVAVDEMEDVARLSGMPEIPRISLSHALNSRAMAMKVAKEYGKSYDSMNFVVAHLGGGISLSAHRRGRLIDVVADDEGPFSPERAGRVPCKKLVDLCYSGEYDKKTLQKKLRGNGGLAAYLGTKDVREVLAKKQEGDDLARLVFESMCYQISKGIGEMAVVLDGAVDAIILTGGIAYSEEVTDYIRKKVAFIAPVEVMPGERELESLAYGALRVIEGDEVARTYTERSGG